MGELIIILILGWGIGLLLMVMTAAGSIAETKGRGKGNWQLLALVYGVLAVIIVYMIPPLDPIPVASRSQTAPEKEERSTS